MSSDRTDIVARLHGHARRIAEARGDAVWASDVLVPDLAAAADEIERLRARWEWWRNACAEADDRSQAAEARIEQLGAARDDAFRAGRAEGYAAGVQTWAAERAAAYRAGAEAMREAAALACSEDETYRKVRGDIEGALTARSLAFTIRALPLPEAPE